MTSTEQPLPMKSSTVGRPTKASTSNPPPMKSKYVVGPTDHELFMARQAIRREKARIRMAKKRAELKLRPLEEQALAAARARVHQATYRAKNRENLRYWEAQRRISIYKQKYGLEAYKSYAAAKRERRRRARAKRLAKAGYPGENERRESKENRGVKAGSRAINVGEGRDTRRAGLDGAKTRI
ncbi:hypothetical protein B0H11DRAFT_2228472 [Mycena galericulata]|nr:hypothetical protein B0H11DRAFT_2228472 [Mycena galericulata]